MGLETALIVGFTALQAVGTMKNANSQAKQVVQSANIDLKNKAKETLLKTARQQVSFLNSGLTLEGTPMAVIEDTFNVGIDDMKQIRTNANNQVKNIISEGRSAALGQLAQGFSGMDMSGVGNSLGKGINSMTGGWTSAQGWTGGLDPSTGITWNSGRY